MNLTYKKLTVANWNDFYTLFKKHKGVRGGCWCAFYLVRPKDFDFKEKEEHREIHYQHVKKYGSTGIIMYDDDIPLGYCQVAKHQVIERYNFSREYNKLSEEIKNQKNWRISCIFVDKDQRKKRLASKLFDFALEYISLNGGGWLEVFPFETEKIPPGNFNFNGSVEFYTKREFERVAKIGKTDLLMRKFIEKSNDVDYKV